MMPLPPNVRTEYTNEFASNLSAARRRRGISQEALARASGLRLGTISLLERAKRTPRLDTICLLAKGLGLKPSELIAGVGDRAGKGRCGG
jgi:transcriptional regulator with XRE-family HTH domain